MLGSFRRLDVVLLGFPLQGQPPAPLLPSADPGLELGSREEQDRAFHRDRDQARGWIGWRIHQSDTSRKPQQGHRGVASRVTSTVRHTGHAHGAVQSKVRRCVVGFSRISVATASFP